MGPVQTVNFLTALNIPPISINTLKAREREIGRTIENYARASCSNALQEEKKSDKVRHSILHFALYQLTKSCKYSRSPVCKNDYYSLDRL